jgi:nucleoside-diphosphate-sugar epimerase
MTILITGGGGYIGTLLVNKLIKQNKKVRVIDNFWFGNFLKKNKNLSIIKKDILNCTSKDLKGVKSIIHLASVANDPASNLDPKLTWEISCLGTMKLCELAKKNGVKKFIFASSGSVYGIKKEKKVHEKLDLVPISDYNKTKMIAEKVIETYNKYFNFYLIRPGTVFGYSPRMRLDLMINILTFQALTKKSITVFGGKQIRPFIHVNDMVDIYQFFLNNKKKSGVYNASAGNLSALETANEIKKIIPDCKINIQKSNDPRSYRLSNEKIVKSGFKFKVKLKEGIIDFINKFHDGKIKKTPSAYSIDFINKIKKA